MCTTFQEEQAAVAGGRMSTNATMYLCRRLPISIDEKNPARAGFTT
jgi:hypothetical protein